MHKPEKDKMTDGWNSLSDDKKADLILQVFKDISKVKGHLRLLVLVTHDFMELLVNILIDHHVKNRKKILSDDTSYPHATRLLILNELGILDDAEYKVFGWFGKLHYDATHKPIFELTEADLSHVSPQEFRDPANFYNLCIDIIGGFWNRHVSVFGPKLSTGTVKSKPKT